VPVPPTVDTIGGLNDNPAMTLTAVLFSDILLSSLWNRARTVAES
jgi:hypothetical protein